MKNLFQDQPEVLTLQEVADLLRIDVQTVKSWCKKGIIKYATVSPRGDKRIHKKDVIEYLQKLNDEPPTISKK